MGDKVGHRFYGNQYRHPTVQQMFDLVSERHKSQTDKAGVPYIGHLIAVEKFLKSSDPELQAIALGHDLMEDTTTTYNEIKNKFGERIANGIKALTKTNQTDREYLEQIKKNPDAVRVKLADLKHNSMLSRLPLITTTDIVRYAKYSQQIKELKAVLD